MDIFNEIRQVVIETIQTDYGITVDPLKVIVSPTKKEFEGDFTIVIFPFVKLVKKSPVELGNSIGSAVCDRCSQISSFNVVKGFLNLTLQDCFWKSLVSEIMQNPNYGQREKKTGEKVMIEYSSPNTNKPLHLGHIRNILLGWSCANILESAGNEVVRVQIVNDRGIAICKSMVAWKNFGNGETPASTGQKGDHFVGKYYVAFETAFKLEYETWQKSDEAETVFEDEKFDDENRTHFFKRYKNNYFNRFSGLGEKAKSLLQKWENGDPEVRNLWEQMNAWVYKGFEQTYQDLDVSFDKLYYESDTWLLGKKEILEGLKKGIFFKKADNSVWVDLGAYGMDQKILLRADGTSVYMTQDIGTAMSRYRDYGVNRMVYVVADEQNYHFQVLFHILKMLGEPFADGLFHLSYGMVDLPSGKMKSREGTVVDADDLMAEVIAEAREVALGKGELDSLDEKTQQYIIRQIGMAALKFFILKVHPKKRMTFDPLASLDMQGQTGPYVQNAYVRIQSVLRKAGNTVGNDLHQYEQLQNEEKVLCNLLIQYPEIIQKAAEDYDPSGLANFAYELAKNFHRFYHELPIIKAKENGAAAFRLGISLAVAQTLKHSMKLLGIEMPARM